MPQQEPEKVEVTLRLDKTQYQQLKPLLDLISQNKTQIPSDALLFIRALIDLILPSLTVENDSQSQDNP